MAYVDSFNVEAEAPVSAVQRRLEYLNLDVLDFDPDNPRLPHSRANDDREVLRYMLESANLLDLMRSIGAQNFFPGEPLLVTESSDGRYEVVEGNRRYAACLLLSRPEMAPTRVKSVQTVVDDADFKPTSIPCLVLPASEIVHFLGYRHITGIQEWSPVAKARYLLRLWNGSEGPGTEAARLRWVAKKIGSRADYVARLLTSLALYEVIAESNFYRIEGLDEETISFSLLVLAMNRPSLVRYIGLVDSKDFELEDLNPRNLEFLVRWFFERDENGRTRLLESRNVSRLVSIIEEPRALAALEAGAPLARAFRLTESQEEILSENLRQALELISAASAIFKSGASASDEDRVVVRKIRSKSEKLESRLLGTSS